MNDIQTDTQINDTISQDKPNSDQHKPYFEALEEIRDVINSKTIDRYLLEDSIRQLATYGIVKIEPKFIADMIELEGNDRIRKIRSISNALDKTMNRMVVTEAIPETIIDGKVITHIRKPSIRANGKQERITRTILYDLTERHKQEL